MRTPVIDAARPFVHLFARLYFRIRFDGVHHIPTDGPLLIVPNHATYADPVFVTIPVRRPIYYMAWSALFNVPGFAWLIRRLRAFPVDIDSTDRRAMRETIRLLQANQAVMIFPEGGRSPDGRLLPFRRGAFRLASSLRVPVLPVTIDGAHEVWPPGRRLPRPGRVTVTYHPPVTAPADQEVKSAAAWLAAEVERLVGSALRGHPEPPLRVARDDAGAD